jgi:hypothetical protein
MSNPRIPDSVSKAFADKETLSVLVEQFIADLTLVDTSTLSTLSRIAEGPDGDCVQIATVSAYLRKTPNRLKAFLLAGIPAMSYYKVFHPLDVYSPQYVISEVTEIFIQKFGKARMFLCTGYLSEKWVKNETLRSNSGSKQPPKEFTVKPVPTNDDINEAMAVLEAVKLPFTATLKQELVQRALDAESALAQFKIEREQELSDRRRASEREISEHRRGKEKAASEAKQLAEASFAKQIKAREDKEKALNDQIALLKAKILDAEGAAALPGLTPADLVKIEANIDKRYRDQLEGWKDEVVRPWLTRLNDAEKAYITAKEGLKLSDEAIRLAREEFSKDLLGNWEQEPLRALPIIEARLGEVDQLVAGSLRPSPQLVKVHQQLREALDSCRADVARLTGEKPKTPLVGAIVATIKQLDFDSLKQITISINQLCDKGVLTPDESTAISKMVNTEVAARKAKNEHENAPGQLMVRDLVAGKEVDILVDAYNIMHIARQHFEKLAVPRKNDPTKICFEANARAKLASMVAIIPQKYPNARVLVFLDGQACESTKPAPGVRMIVPTKCTSGEGQADEEIIYYLCHKVRKADSAYVVSADKQLQKTANRHLSVSIFSGILDEI